MASHARPNVTSETVLKMIQQWNPQPVGNLVAIEEGQISQAYRFQQAGGWFIIRMSPGSRTYWNDEYAYDTLSSVTQLPIPRILFTGMEQELTFAISECMPGSTLAHLPAEDIYNLLPEVARLLQKLQSAVPELPGRFGAVRSELFPEGHDWRSGLELFFAVPGTGYWKDWPKLLDQNWIGAQRFWAMHKRMLDLALLAPITPNVVHGDFHCGNILAEGDRITGLIDWAQMFWGDWIFDLATFQFWSPQFNLAKLVYEQGADLGFDMSHFQERFWCSCYAIGLDALRYMAKIGDDASGSRVMEQLQRMEQASWACFN